MSWPNSKFSIETEARNAPKLCSWLWFLLRSAALINIWYISRTYSLEGSQIVLHAIYRNNFICHWNVVTSEVKGRAENRNIAAMMWKKGRLILKADELSFLEPESEPLKPTYFTESQKKNLQWCPIIRFLALRYCWNTAILCNSSLDLFFHHNTIF